jgi:8-oxo-dGTP pyrophosphatase MutT (NUDIX family)
MQNNLKPFKILEETILFEYPTKRYKVVGAKLETPDGKEVEWSYFKMKDLVVVLALDANKNVFLKTEWRLNRNDFLTEVASGFVEVENPTEEQIIATEQRELQEEIGYKAGKLTKLKTLHLFNHLTTKAHFFLAEELQKSEMEKDEFEFLDVQKIQFDEAYEFVLNQQIPNAQIQIIFMLVRELLSKRQN